MQCAYAIISCVWWTMNLLMKTRLDFNLILFYNGSTDWLTDWLTVQTDCSLAEDLAWATSCISSTCTATISLARAVQVQTINEGITRQSCNCTTISDSEMDCWCSYTIYRVQRIAKRKVFTGTHRRCDVRPESRWHICTHKLVNKLSDAAYFVLLFVCY
jgi:hypothetical protein